MASELAAGHRKPRVCFVAPDIFPVFSRDRSTAFAGGAEVQQSFIARGLRDAGYPVSIVTRVDGQAPDFDFDGVRVVRILRSPRELPVIRNVHPRLTSVWNALTRADADIYYQRCAGANTLVTALFCKRHQRRSLYAGANDPDFRRDQVAHVLAGRGGWRERQMFQWGLKLADGIVAQHAGQVAACRRWYGREAVEIPNCYAAPEGATAARAGVVLWVATVKSLKRPELFLELARSLPQLRFRMVGGAGPGKEAEVFERTRRAAAALPNVEFVGFVPFAEVEAHFDAARVFVNTSDYEGFPNTFLQSWARGVPTVSFFDCGARDAGRPVGFVCRDLDEMRQAVSQLAADDTTWALEGERAQAHFEAHHSVAMAVERYSRLFTQVLAAKGRG